MRISRPIKLGAALAAASLPYLSVADICEAEYPEYLLVYKPEDLEIIGRDCTTIIGDLGFNDTWSGPFILPGVENITGTIRVERWQQGRVRQPNVTRVELPDLKYIYEMDFLFSPAVNVSAPKLESARGIWLGQEAHGSEAHFPALREVEWLGFRGNYSRTEVPVLKRADYLDICSFGNNCGFGVDEGPGPSIIDPLKITLPALESVGELIIGGKTASISAPKLTNVSESAKFQLPDSAASLDFPELNHVAHSLEVEGAIARIHVPSLHNTTASVKVSSTTPLNISLPLAGNPRFLGFFGEIAGLSLPNLTDFQNLQIHSDLPLDCGPLDEKFEPIVEEIVETEWAREGRYQCNSTALGGGSRAMKPVFAGVVAAGIGAGLVLW
ncbi:hypothetical protein BJY01DRAFT_250366 [Aspergillus pseudoustus]|uniref:Uncharacterized protein n=1 Tax=Aspergillus pseudoustus TaxID=1810923 RepID=A0ABR4JKK1_9EURO